MEIRSLLGKELLYFDGAMGSLLQASGLKPGALPELMNLMDGSVIEDIHSAYLDAGCNILLANTFGANRLKLEPEGYSVEEIVRCAVGHVRAAIGRCRNGAPHFAALDIGPTGKLLAPLGELPFEEAYDIFREIAVAGENAGSDLVLLETFTDLYEMKAAVLAVKENTGLPVFATLSFNEDEKLLTGGDVEAAVALLEGLRVDALGINCGMGPVQFRPLFEQLKRFSSLPLILNPNAGMPKVENENTVYDIDEETFAREMFAFAQQGAHLLGGCCGTTPRHIQRMTTLCRDVACVPPQEKGRTVVSSYACAQVLGELPVIVGERINPTGKKRFKEALRTGEMEYLLSEGIAQQENGAHILDVNVGLPEIDEEDMMVQAVTKLQSVLRLPLQIDTSNPVVMERALRLYNGKAMVNSVNGKEEVMHAVFPLVQKYGGVVVALTLDETGIPDTAQGRLAIARKIVKTAASYGIPARDIVVDALTMTVSSDDRAACVTLEALSLIKKELHVKTILGVSNISFGLPRREAVNSAFFTLALRAGLDAGIINPGAQPMMDAYISYCTLAGYDPHCAAYVSRFSQQGTDVSAPAAASLTLYDAVRKGLHEKAHELAVHALEEQDPTQIIDRYIVPALNAVGKGFEEKTVFLPQLMMSAEAAKAAFEAIRHHLEASGTKQEKRGKIVLATVQGDIHDIGKNIAGAMLENYGYEVIDLGKNVPCEEVVEAVEREQAPLVGLSALMTTTVPFMEKTIRLLRARRLPCKIMVGGAVLTQEYADLIGADCYAKDAMTGVAFANTVFTGSR